MKAEGKRTPERGNRRENKETAVGKNSGAGEKSNRLVDRGQRMTQNYRKSSSFSEETN